MITKLSNSITYQDTENMDEYERMFILQKLIQLRKEENDAKEQAFNKIQRK